LDNDGVRPYTGLSGVYAAAETLRHRAVDEVLCRIPEEDYQKLCGLIGDFLWFIPRDEDNYGEIKPFPVTVEPPQDANLRPYAKVLYLSPTLEKRPPALVVAVVAHELAHLVLSHRLHNKDRASYDKQEAEAWERACSWGFEQEVQVHHGTHKGDKATLKVAR